MVTVEGARTRHVDGGQPSSGVKGAHREVPETPELAKKRAISSNLGPISHGCMEAT
jgi:hypothetical protein